MTATPFPQPSSNLPPPWPERESPRPEEEPAVDLAEYLKLLWVRRWLVLGVAAFVLLLGGSWALTRTRLYRATTDISVGERTPQIVQGRLDLGPNFWELERYADQQVRVLTTLRLAQRVAGRLGLAGLPEFAGRDPGVALKAKIEIERVKETNIVKVSLTDTDSKRAAQWLNTYVEEYIASNIEDNLERARKVYQVIESRLDPLREQLAQSERQMMTFREREDALLFADQDKNVITEQVNTLTSEYASAKAERIRLETKIAALASLSPADLADAAPPEVLEDPTIQSLRQQRTQLQVELPEKLRTLKEGHPQIKELRSRLAEVEARLQERMASIRGSLQTQFEIVRRREQSLYEHIQELKEQSIELSKQTMEYERLKRDYDQNKAFLEDMLARSKEVDISSTAAVNNVRVIEPAVAPTGPFSPNLKRTLALSLMLGLLLGMGLVLGLDYLDQTFRTPDQVERFLGLEVLALLPKHGEDRERVVREAMQSLRTALLLAVHSEGCQILLVTSAVPGEGKTTVAFELARVLTTGASRVLLLDADLRRPRLHRWFDTPNSVGLTSVVLGEVDLAGAVGTVRDLPGLRVVTSGPLPPNPPELFSSVGFQALLERARQEYDWVVIDSAPVASVTDAVICSRLVDMALLVVEYGGPRRQIVRGALRQLGRSGVRIPGVLLNKVDLVREHYYYYSGYTYYRYGYAQYHERPRAGDEAIRNG